MTGITLDIHPSRKSVLSLAVAPLVLISAHAAAQESARRGYTENSWSLETSIFYSDNFQRMSDEAVRFDISEDTLLGYSLVDGTTDTFEAVYGPLYNQEDVKLETPDNVIGSVVLTGSTLIKRQAFAALISGSVRFGSYLDRDDIDERMLKDSSPAAPTTASFYNPLTDADEDLAVAESTFGRPGRTESYIDPNLRAVGTLRLVENLFYVDVNGLVQQQSFGLNGLASTQGVSQTGDQVTFAGGSISPYLLHQFADESSVELRARATAIEVIDENIDLTGDPTLTEEAAEELDGAQYENDSRSYELLADYQTGSKFDKVLFRVGGFLRHVEEKGSDLLKSRNAEFDQASASLDTKLHVTRGLRLTAGVGLDEIDFADRSPLSSVNPEGATTDEIAEQEEREDALSGVFWRVGFEYAPSTRSKLSATFGERYDGTSIEVSGQYRPTPRLLVTAEADRQLNSGLQDYANSSFSTQSQAFRMLTGLAESQSSTSMALLDRALSFEGSSFRTAHRGQIGIAAIDRVRLGLRGNFRRTNFGLGLQYTDAEEFRRDTESYSFDADIARRLSKRFSVNGSARYTYDDGVYLISDVVNDIETAEPYESSELYYSLGLAYQLGTKLSLTGTAYHVERDTEGEPRSSQLDYSENAIGLGLRWAF